MRTRIITAGLLALGMGIAGCGGPSGQGAVAAGSPSASASPSPTGPLPVTCAVITQAWGDMKAATTGAASLTDEFKAIAAFQTVVARNLDGPLVQGLSTAVGALAQAVLGEEEADAGIGAVSVASAQASADGAAGDVATAYGALATACG